MYKSRIITNQIGFINQFTHFDLEHNYRTDENSLLIMDRLLIEFNQYTSFYLKDIFDKKLETFIYQKIEKLRKDTQQNAIPLFWLGIIDMQLYID